MQHTFAYPPLLAILQRLQDAEHRQPFLTNGNLDAMKIAIEYLRDHPLPAGVERQALHTATEYLISIERFLFAPSLTTLYREDHPTA